MVTTRMWTAALLHAGLKAIRVTRRNTVAAMQREKQKVAILHHRNESNGRQGEREGGDTHTHHHTDRQEEERLFFSQSMFMLTGSGTGANGVKIPCARGTPVCPSCYVCTRFPC